MLLFSDKYSNNFIVIYDICAAATLNHIETESYLYQTKISSRPI